MKYLKYLGYSLMGISLIIVALGVSSNNVNAMINWTLALTFITMLSVVFGAIWASVQDPKAAVQSMIGGAVVLVVLGISCALADTTPIVTPVNIFDNKTDLIVADTGLYATYFAFFTAVLAIAGTEFYNLIKK